MMIKKVINRDKQGGQDDALTGRNIVCKTCLKRGGWTCRQPARAETVESSSFAISVDAFAGRGERRYKRGLGPSRGS